MSDTARSWFLAQSEEPVIPDFGEGSDCVVENRFFCTDWVRENWSGVIQPALLEHVKLMLIAVVIGFAIAFVAAIVTHRYTLLILYRNILEGLRGVPADVLEAARGMGLTRRQTLWRVELPLAVPAMMAGLRVAVVSTIALATVAALVVPQGLGYPIFLALRESFKTEIIVAGGLAVLLALLADALLVVAERALTPWARVRRTT